MAIFRYAAVVVLCSAFLHAVLADLSVLTNLPVNHEYTDVHSAYVAGGFYVMIYVGTRDVDPKFLKYSIGLYELINGTHLLHYNPNNNNYSIKSENSDLRLTAKPNTGSIDSMISAIAKVCSASECAGFYVGKQVVLSDRTYSWCHRGINDNDRLQSVTEILDYTAAVVSRDTELLGLVCLPNAEQRTLRLLCTDGSDVFTSIHSVETTIDSEKLNIFVLLSSTSKTALCTFTQKLRPLALVRTTVTLQQTSKLLFGNAPRALAVSAAANDHVAFVSSSTGKINKVCIQFCTG